jgi:alkylation response protein AidB-like acyl-CoA dehydrogenase
MEGPTTVTDLRYSADEEELRSSVRTMLAERSPSSRVLARAEGDEPIDEQLWRILAVDMGLAGLAVPADRGGAGATWREVAVVLEELGRCLAPVPYLGSAVIATAALLQCEDADLLKSVASGSRVAALLVPLAASPHDPLPLAVRSDGDRLTGTVLGVADALPADLLLVPTLEGLFVVDGSASGVDRAPVTSLDLTRRLADVTLTDTPGRRIAGAVTADAAVRAALLAGAGLLASEQFGLAQYCLDSTVEYTKNRYQFARPVGGFQAIKHRLADLWVDVTQARAAARYAAAALADDDPDATVAVTVAKAYCSGVAVHAAEECIQLHGGIGFTWEHPAHLYLKRAKSSAIALGTPDRHRTALARLVNLPV